MKNIIGLITSIFISKPKPHVHVWRHEYFGGRKAGAHPSSPMSEVASCECGEWSVRHFGELERIILKNSNDNQQILRK